MSDTSTTTTYLITGASSGLGLEFVKQLAARQGSHVIATCRKKESSATGVDSISAVVPAEGSKVTILEGIDAASDDCKTKIIEGLKANSCHNIDVVIHNAGIFGSKGRDSQSFDNCSTQAMLDTVNLNGMGPLRVQQALCQAELMTEGGKVAVISSGLGSIGDNGSGGMYAYRGSKALVNMVTKGMSVDLKKKGIAVMSLAPGFVSTEFGGMGKETMAKMGAMPPEKSIGQMLQAIDDLSLDTTGKFMSVNSKGDSPREYPGGW